MLGWLFFAFNIFLAPTFHIKITHNSKQKKIKIVTQNQKIIFHYLHLSLPFLTFTQKYFRISKYLGFLLIFKGRLFSLKIFQNNKREKCNIILVKTKSQSSYALRSKMHATINFDNSFDSINMQNFVQKLAKNFTKSQKNVFLDYFKYLTYPVKFFHNKLLVPLILILLLELLKCHIYQINYLCNNHNYSRTFFRYLGKIIGWLIGT